MSMTSRYFLEVMEEQFQDEEEIKDKIEEQNNLIKCWQEYELLNKNNNGEE